MDLVMEKMVLVVGQVPESTNDENTIWIFQFTVSDSVQDDGDINFQFVAEDRSNNPVDQFVDANSLELIINLLQIFNWIGFYSWS